jgi:hypothetical protein
MSVRLKTYNRTDDPIPNDLKEESTIIIESDESTNGAITTESNSDLGSGDLKICYSSLRKVLVIENALTII